MEAGEYRLLIDAHANNYGGEVYGAHGFSYSMSLFVIPVPEPTEGALGFLGLLLLALRARRG